MRAIRYTAALLGILCTMTNANTMTESPPSWANRSDRELANTFERREADWRNGAIVYQVLVDRFAPSARLEAKRGLYPSPKVIKRWDEVPRQGRYLDEQRLWSHEIEFWGGDLPSVMSRLDYIRQLGATVLYLNPIHLAYTNHKYDALDYQEVSPEFGTRDDVKALARELKAREMKLVLDGVFNHMGRQSPKFREAQRDPSSPYRQWFFLGPSYPSGARGWWNVENLPEINLENPAVRAHIWGAPDSVVRRYLRDGVDGWRLDVAFDIGFHWLEQLTQAAHAEKPGSLVVGEIANYPKDWFPSVDAVMHFTLRHLILRTARGQLDAATAERMISRLIHDAGLEPMLKSWIYLDNHDTPRLATELPDERQRRLAQVLQFTLPGSPNLYYGSEVAMTGGDDPQMRAPMRWDLVDKGHPWLDWTRRLISVRQAHRALRVGDYRTLTSRQLLAFERYTDRAADTVMVVVNPTGQEVRETLLVANSKLMDGSRLIDLLGTSATPVRVHSSLMEVTLPPFGVLVVKPDTRPTPEGYTNYKRVQ